MMMSIYIQNLEILTKKKKKHLIIDFLPSL